MSDELYSSPLNRFDTSPNVHTNPDLDPPRLKTSNRLLKKEQYY